MDENKSDSAVIKDIPEIDIVAVLCAVHHIRAAHVRWTFTRTKPTARKFSDASRWKWSAWRELRWWRAHLVVVVGGQGAINSESTSLLKASRGIVGCAYILFWPELDLTYFSKRDQTIKQLIVARFQHISDLEHSDIFVASQAVSAVPGRADWRDLGILVLRKIAMNWRDRKRLQELQPKI